MSNNLSAADQKLSQQQQEQISALKQAWADAKAAGDQAAMDEAHRQAEAIRNAAGYSGGADGSGYVTMPTGGGQSVGDVKKWVEEYYHTNYSPSLGWVNGYSVEMNTRSMANYIRQQMQANSNAWASADEAGKAYLHQQNVELAQILADAVGGAESIYNEELGRWETYNANLGYGYNIGQYKDADIEDWYKGQWGMTDEQIAQYRNDTARYYNYVDQDLLRNLVDESSGYTGVYAPFVYGPAAALHQGTNVLGSANLVDRIGDGFNEENHYLVQRDANGNVIPRAPALKQTAEEMMSDYTRQFASYVDENGVIQPGVLVQSSPGGNRVGATGTIGFPQLSETEKAQAERLRDSGVLDQLLSGGTGSGSQTLDQWQQAAEQQVVNQTDQAVSQAVQQLLLAQQEADKQFQTQRDQIAADERQGLDNSALYAALRGDRGGIGQAQYNSIQAAAAANRQTVNSAQVKLATDTARQIADLRAQGEFEKADKLLEIAQTYLLKLLELEQWAAEFGLDQQKFQTSVTQWQLEFLQKSGSL